MTFPTLRDFQSGSAEVGQLLVDRTGAASAPIPKRGCDHLGECLALGIELGRIEVAIHQRITLHALTGDVKRKAVSQRICEHGSARPQRVPHADFVPHIWIVQRQVGHDELGQQQLLEHVDMDRAAPALGIGPVGLEPGSLNGRRKQLRINRVEIDFGAVRGLLSPNGMMTKARRVDDIAFLCDSDSRSTTRDQQSQIWRKPGEVILLDLDFGDCLPTARSSGMASIESSFCTASGWMSLQPIASRPSRVSSAL